MKTNRTAWTARIESPPSADDSDYRGIEFGISQSLANRIAKISVQQTDSPQASTVNVADFIVAGPLTAYLMKMPRTGNRAEAIKPNS